MPERADVGQVLQAPVGKQNLKKRYNRFNGRLESTRFVPMATADAYRLHSLAHCLHEVDPNLWRTCGPRRNPLRLTPADDLWQAAYDTLASSWEPKQTFCNKL